MKKIKDYFIFAPKTNQLKVLNLMEAFLDQDMNDTFILCGAAGTGKTSMTTALSNYLTEQNTPFHLCAPTGRAAMIVSQKTGIKANTLHHLLYTVKEINDKEGHPKQLEFIPRINISKTATIFIVDESSMISNEKPGGDEMFVSKNSLLFDLIQYVKTGHSENKIIFIGDEYQLPPVKAFFSPALNTEFLQKEYKLNPIKANLTEIIRQKNDSYILKTATEIKESIDRFKQPTSFEFINTQNLDNFLLEYIQKQKQQANSVALLGWRNVSIDDLNRQIRNLKFGYEASPIVENEQLIVTQNYYQKPFLSNGTLVQVTKVINIEDYHGFKFANVKLLDLSMEKAMDGSFKIRLDHLYNHNDSDFSNQEKKLYALRIKANKDFRDTKDKRLDAYLSALKVKYGYAITVHKAQGGEWKNVFIYPEIPYGQNAGKWLYTAVTRASENIYSFDKN